MKLFEIFGEVLLKDQASKELDNIDKKGEKSSGKLKKAFGAIGKGATLMGGAVVAAGGAMFAMATKAGDAADRLLDLKAITGMSTEEIQKWEKVTKVAGVNIDAMTNASQKFTRSLDMMDEESHKGRAALEGLGLSLEDINNMNADERMDAITSALASVEDTTKRAKLGTDLLGGSWKEIAPIVDMGTEAMQKAKDSANVIDEDQLNKANEFRIKVAELKDQFGYFFIMLSISVMPILNKFMNWISQYMPQIQATSKQVFEIIGKAVETFIGWIGKLIDWLKDWYDNNQDTVDAIKESFNDFVDSVVNLVEGFIDLFKRIWEKYGDQILKSITNSIDLIKAVFEGAFDLIVDIFNVFASLFKGDWEQLWKDVKTLASNLWDNIKNIIDTAIDKVVETFKDINLYQIGKDIIQGLINGLSNMLGKVKEKAAEIANSIGDKVKSFFGIRSPSRLMMEYGENIGDGLAIGVEDSKHEVARASENLNEASYRTMDIKSPMSNKSTEKGVQPIINITLDNAIITDDYGVDRLMERIVERMQVKGGFAL